MVFDLCGVERGCYAQLLVLIFRSCLNEQLTPNRNMAFEFAICRFLSNTGDSNKIVDVVPNTRATLLRI